MKTIDRTRLGELYALEEQRSISSHPKSQSLLRRPQKSLLVDVDRHTRIVAEGVTELIDTARPATAGA